MSTKKNTPISEYKGDRAPLNADVYEFPNGLPSSGDYRQTSMTL